MNDYTPPVLLSELTRTQKLRIIALDYVTGMSQTSTDIFLREADKVFDYLENGLTETGEKPKVQPGVLHIIGERNNQDEP
jgi:hypothetical protein